MTFASDKISFPGSQGAPLAARLDRPQGRPRAYALFAHCFTCTKDVLAASRIAQGMTAHGIAVLRFDFTGLGASDGEFANTNFSSNIEDLVAAADYLRKDHQAPALLIGHSLGGAAVLAAAARIAESRAVCTIAAPADPSHVAKHFQEATAEIEAKGEAVVRLVGRPFRIRKQFLDDIAAQRLEPAIANLRKALLVFHAPTDSLVGIENASRIFLAAKHPKSFVSLDGADHLLTRPADAAYVADVIAVWAQRYLDAERAVAPSVPAAEPGEVVVAEAGVGKFQQIVSVGGRHVLRADEPIAYGGDDTGPSPYDLLLAGLGACTAMTVRMYAERKGLVLGRVAVRLRHRKIHAEDCAECETKEGMVDRIEREIRITGDLDPATRAKVLEIAEKCPVHRTLQSEVRVETRVAE